MISKERLIELVKEKANIYYKYHNEDIQKIELLPNHLVYNDGKKDFIHLFGEVGLQIVLEDLFETQEDAKEHMEFANVIRTDKLPYISWNERNIIIYNFYSPIKKGAKQYEFRLFKGGNITIWRTDDMYKVFNAPTTRENYILACRKAKELFLGETNE